jgi:PAS domain S-box-containing protein
MDFAKIVAAAGDAIVAADPEGRIVLWNPSAERIFGFSPAEALGQSLDIIIPERLRERHWQGYGKVMQSGETRYGTEVLRVPALRKDGRPLSIAFTVALLKRADGTVESIVAIMRDDTARWNEERALKKRLAELADKAK